MMQQTQLANHPKLLPVLTLRAIKLNNSQKNMAAGKMAWIQPATVIGKKMAVVSIFKWYRM